MDHARAGPAERGRPAGPARLTPSERRRLAPLAAALAGARAPGPSRLEVVAGSLAPGRRHGLLAGTFNPFTRAHAALAVAGHRAGCERVVLAMAPVSLDKQGLERAHPVDRLDWTRAWAARHRWAAVAVASHPLLVDMAEALRAAGAGEVVLLVGADKAAQLVDPRYYTDSDAALTRLAAAATILVADRAGHARPLALALPDGAGRTGSRGQPGSEAALAVRPLATPDWVPARSATEARQAAADGGDLRSLVPALVARAAERTHAYHRDPADYLARARELERLGAAAPS
jgi:nicotinic acid mononucleotide adenylyltransferase